MAKRKRRKPDRRSRANRTERRVDLSSLWTIAGFNLRMLDLRMMKSYSERIAETGLTPAAATIVLVLENNPGVALGKLADALLVKRPNMTKLVKRLENRGLIRRRAASDDRRSISVILTSAGQRQAKRLRTLQDLQDSFALAALSHAERFQLMMLIARILETLDAEDRV
jgi:DNA-binding MarR family transcriptional regulator